MINSYDLLLQFFLWRNSPMSKAEYRYYELSQEIPLLVLTGGSSKKNSRKRAIINMRFYPLPLIFFCFLTG